MAGLFSRKIPRLWIELFDRNQTGQENQIAIATMRRLSFNERYTTSDIQRNL
jgi:hypothetical protein